MKGASKLLMALLTVTVVLVAVFWPFGKNRESASEPCRRWELKWVNRHRSLCQQALAGPSDVVFIGDSITQNWEASGSEVWRHYYSGRNALNLGIASDRTQHVLWRVTNTDFTIAAPKLFVLLVGTNNSADDTSDETAAGVEAIVALLQQKIPTAKILLMAIFPRGERAEDPRRLTNYATNEKIRHLADGKSVVFADINSKLVRSDNAANLKLMPDALHLNEAGYRVWAAVIEPQVRALLGEPKLPAPEGLEEAREQ